MTTQKNDQSNDAKVSKEHSDKNQTAQGKRLKEIRYTCNSCGNVWYRLPIDESKAVKGCAGAFAGLSCCAAPCCFPLYFGAAASTQAEKRCHKCHSGNIKREIVEYDKEGHSK